MEIVDVPCAPKDSERLVHEKGRRERSPLGSAANLVAIMSRVFYLSMNLQKHLNVFIVLVLSRGPGSRTQDPGPWVLDPAPPVRIIDLLKRAVQNRNSEPPGIAFLLKRVVQNRDSGPPGNRDSVEASCTKP